MGQGDRFIVPLSHLVWENSRTGLNAVILDDIIKSKIIELLKIGVITMLEAFKGLNLLDPKFYIPVLIGIVVLFIVIKVAKKLVKFVLVLAVIGLALLIYFNMPGLKVEDGTAVLNLKGQEYTLDPKDMKIESEDTDGKTRVFLVSGTTRIELPFSKAYAEKFILDKLKGE